MGSKWDQKYHFPKSIEDGECIFRKLEKMRERVGGDPSELIDTYDDPFLIQAITSGIGGRTITPRKLLDEMMWNGRRGYGNPPYIGDFMLYHQVVAIAKAAVECATEYDRH